MLHGAFCITKRLVLCEILHNPIEILHRMWYNKNMELSHLEKYSENNRIEAKRATGGFPQSVWETYSAFANTLGGVILLGVEEKKDYSLRAVTLPDPEGLAEEFWRLVNDESKVSANILSRKQVAVEEVDGKKIVVITVPRACRQEKPVYVGLTPFNGSYRRNGEGDYKCDALEVQEMLSAREERTQDMQIFADLPLEALSKSALQSYRASVQKSRPSHPFEGYDDKEFFRAVGAVGLGEDGKYHPTAAGLLLFGEGEEIAKKFPTLRLEYRENGVLAYSYQNVYEFYFAAGERAAKGFPLDVKKALLEGLGNALINADYFGGGEIIARREEGEILFSNPGGFAIDLARARKGGLADPRNDGIARLFRFVDVGVGMGSGIPHVYGVWKAQGYLPPTIIEEKTPPRILFRLPLERGTREGGIRGVALQREWVISHLTACALASEEALFSELGDLAAVEELLAEGIIVKKDGNYKLKR